MIPPAHTHARAGNIRSGSDAAARIPATDLEKRETAIAEKRTKLKSPLFFVSPLRLSVRNLAKGVDDGALKALAKAAARDGLAAGLASHTEGDPLLMASCVPSPDGGKKPPRVTVVSAKVMREPTSLGEKGSGLRARLEDDGVTARSKGYAFVEFSEHLHALAALRQLNNNPEYSATYAAGGAAAVSSTACACEASATSAAGGGACMRVRVRVAVGAITTLISTPTPTPHTRIAMRVVALPLSPPPPSGARQAPGAAPPPPRRVRHREHRRGEEAREEAGAGGGASPRARRGDAAAAADRAARSHRYAR